MRHRKAGAHLSRTSAHRRALFSNMVASLIEHEAIRTTHAKALATRRVAERTITIARRLGDVLTKDPDKRTQEEAARVVHAMRTARKTVRSRAAIQKLFEEIAPRYVGRLGGYTRIVKLGDRAGDAAPISLLELMPDEASAESAQSTKGSKGAKDTKGDAPAGKGKGKAKAKADSDEAPAKAAKAKKPAAKK